MPPTRRQFLAAAGAVGATAALGMSAPSRSRLAPTADSVIFLMLTGGPSQLDTFDPKPDAPSDVRSPFAAVPTKVPGLHLTELFPKMAGIADKFALVRSVHHTDAPIHEVGFQWVNTGRLFRDGPEWPSVGSVHCTLNGVRTPTGHERHYVAPDTNVDTGVDVGRGYGPGFLGEKVGFQGDLGRNCPDDAEALEMFRRNGWTSDRYPFTAFGQNCLGAFRSVERSPGRFIHVNQFSTVFDRPSWDCHATYGGPLSCSLADYRDTVAPSFDAAFTQLVTDLDQRGLLDRTLVVATGEFGRTPKFNCNGGRDHWPGVWTAVFAGGGVKGGRVIGASDAIASEPKDRPVHAADIPATIFHALGIGPDATIPGPSGSPVLAYTGRPIGELF